jgi:hypothetical protein
VHMNDLPLLKVAFSKSIPPIATYSGHAAEYGKTTGATKGKVPLVLDCLKSPWRGHVSMGARSAGTRGIH